MNRINIRAPPALPFRLITDCYPCRGKLISLAVDFDPGGLADSMNNHFHKVQDSQTLNELLEQSSEKPVIIFKHSTTCPISAGAYDQMEAVTADVALVEVQTAREVSREIAENTGIEHASPQVIILRSGKPVWNASHWDITSEKVEQALRENH